MGSAMGKRVRNWATVTQPDIGSGSLVAFCICFAVGSVRLHRARGGNSKLGRGPGWQRKRQEGGLAEGKGAQAPLRNLFCGPTVATPPAQAPFLRDDLLPVSPCETPVILGKNTLTEQDGRGLSLRKSFGSYLAQGINLKLGFTLQGSSPGSQTSDLAENLTIQNTLNAPVTLHLFAYSDFDLADEYLSDSVSLPATGTMVQQGKGLTVTETVQAPAPSHWEASFYSIILDDLDSTNAANLSDSFIPPDPGDQTFAFQWDVTLGAGQSVVINLNNNIQPTPIQLNIASLGVSVVVSWPTNGATGYQLFSTGILPAGSSWSAVTNTMEVVGDQYQVTLPHSFGAQFYRLQK
jgi:hypothetical protein